MYPNDEETALWVALNRTQQTIYWHMDQALKNSNLPPLRWYDVLWAIERSGKSGVRAYQLSDLLLFEQSNLSRLLRRIINLDLVEESVFQRDRRGKVLTITAKGRRIRQQMWEVYGPLIQVFMSGVSGRQIGKMEKALKALGASALQSNQTTTFTRPESSISDQACR